MRLSIGDRFIDGLFYPNFLFSFRSPHNDVDVFSQKVESVQSQQEEKVQLQQGQSQPTTQNNQTNQTQAQVATSQANFVDTNGNSEGNEILVLVPALNSNGLTTANITTADFRENVRNTERKINNQEPTNFNRENNRNIVTEQIVWIPKIEAQDQQAPTPLNGNATCQPPPLYSRIKQLNYSQVAITNTNLTGLLVDS